VVLAGWVGCAGSGQLQRADTHATARAQTHERGAAAKQSPKNDDRDGFESVLPVVID
jgi:hypothetical protein